MRTSIVHELRTRLKSEKSQWSFDASVGLLYMEILLFRVLCRCKENMMVLVGGTSEGWFWV